MIFSSLSFLFLFLPLFLVIYYLAPMRQRSWVILLGSYLFYAWWRLDFLFLFIAVTAFSYLVSRWMVSVASPYTRFRILWVGVGGNLAVLGYFKYANFGVDSFNLLLDQAHLQPIAFTALILPIGISFYIFQSISYLVDVYRNDVTPARRFVDFAAFIALFPQLIAGPVLRYKDVEQQFASRTHSLALFNEGVMRFAIGFVKKVLIADSLAPIADAAFHLQEPGTLDVWVGVLAYAMQLYFDFSGYSDMAIGLGLMLGFRFMENFNQPYISRSITEFWQRWHISLSTWLRDYLYIPLGGNRKGRIRTCINLFLTMLLGGIWHGAGWTYICWGAWHGLWLVVERLTKGSKAHTKAVYPYHTGWLLTLILVLVGWVFFRAHDINNAISMLSAMWSFKGGFILSDAFAWQVRPLHLLLLGVAWGIALCVPVAAIHRRLESPHPFWQITMMLLFGIAIAKLVAEAHSPFLYFQF